MWQQITSVVRDYFGFEVLRFKSVSVQKFKDAKLLFLLQIHPYEQIHSN